MKSYFKNSLVASLLAISVFQLPAFSVDQNNTNDQPKDQINTDNYDSSLNLIQEKIKNSNFKDATTDTLILLQKYPNNIELKSILARLYRWQNKYDESIKLYKEVIQQNPNDQEIVAEYNKFAIAKELIDLKESKNSLPAYQYEQKLTDFYNSGKDIYNGGYLLGMYYIEKRNYKKASEVFEELHKIYSTDRDINILYIESLIESKNYAKAKLVYDNIEEEEISLINKDRGDISYRLEKNYFSIRGGLFQYSKGLPNEREFTLEMSQQLGDFTLVPKVSNINRFNLSDNQLGLDFYANLGDRRWGVVSASISPDAEFLPVWTAGAEVYQGLGNSEFSLGYTRMNFADTGVNIVKPGVRIYLPYNIAIEEKLNIVPETQSMLLLSTLNFEPNHKFRGFYTLGVGQLAERITSSQDIQKLNTYTHTIGLQYRFMPQLSLNSEFMYNYREGLYDVKGASIYTRYWW